MAGKGKVDAVFILRRLQEEYLDKEKKCILNGLLRPLGYIYITVSQYNTTVSLQKCHIVQHIKLQQCHAHC